MTIFNSSESMRELSTFNFEFIRTLFNFVKYHLCYALYYLCSLIHRNESHNYLNVRFDFNKEISTQSYKRKCVSYDDANAIVLKWDEQMFKTFETDVELGILPKNSWVLDMSYDEGDFTKYCAKKYPELNFVFFTNKTDIYNESINTFPKNTHIFFLTPSHFVNQRNNKYEEFVINNNVGYRRVFVSQGTEYWYNFPAIFERIDKSLFKDYGNKIKSYLLLYKISLSYKVKYVPKPTPNFYSKTLDFLGFFNTHLKEVSKKEIKCNFESAINHLNRSEPHAVLSSFYRTKAIFISKHVLHPVSDFNNN